MALSPGTRLGVYEVSAKIGEGGMGEVYQARDTKLDRNMALKVLPEAFTADPDRLARFEREAKVLASLNHPNIGSIYGLEEAAGVRALVLELIEGPTLADLIAARSKENGGIPLDEALSIATQIAEALEAAHEAGVIHRDLKPANIKVREDGTVKVLDFGLAKALDPHPEGDPDQSPTLTAAATQMGVTMGTAAYMSPEQARGKPVDKRADIWAFGAVLYEMLTGRRAFEGEDVSLTLSAVLQREPALTALPAGVPPVLRSYVHRCFEKDPRQRIRDIGDVRLALEGVFETTARSPSEPAAPAQLQLRQRPLPATLAALGLVVTSGLAVWSGTRPTDTTRTSYLELALPTATSETGIFVNFIDISDDGRHIVVDTGTGPFTLYDLDEPGGGVAIAGTEGATHPLLSPDGDSIAYMANNVLLRRLLSGGNLDSITAPGAPDLFGASWAPDDRILFVPAWPSNVLAVSAAPGSEPVSVIEIDPSLNEVGHTQPQLLPDGRILYGWDDNWFIAVADPETGERDVLFHNGHGGHYVPTGHLVYAREHYLFARTFDLDTLEVGEPRQILDNLKVDAVTGRGSFAISDNGVLAYLTGPDELDRTMVKIWPDGRREPLTDDRRRYTGTLRISPDGRQLVMNMFPAVGGGGFDVWVYDMERDNFQAIAQDDGWNEMPTWSTDGRSIVWTTETIGAGDLLIRPADASAPARPLFVDERVKHARASHPSGKYLISTDPNAGFDLWVYAEDDPDNPEPFVRAPANQAFGSFSPDGRHIAYDSDEFGAEVYVRAYPRRDEASDRVQRISRDGGREPIWMADDRIVYRQGTRAMEVRVTDNGSELTFSDPIQLFDGLDNSWTISPDGTYVVSLELIEPQRLMVVLDWFEELERLVPTN